MSKRMRYFFLNTAINAYISHTLDVLNFQSDANGLKTAKEKLNLLKQLFTKKSYSTIIFLFYPMEYFLQHLIL